MKKERRKVRRLSKEFIIWDYSIKIYCNIICPDFFLVKCLEESL